MKKKTALLLLQYAIFFGLGFALIYWQYSRLSPGDLADLKESVSQVRTRAWIIFPVVIIGFFSHYIRAMRWKLMLEPLHIRPSTVNITGAVLIGYLTNLLIPRMGEVAKCTVLARYEEEPADKIIGTIVAERTFDLLCLILICVLTVAVQANLVRDYLDYLAARMNGRQLLLSAGLALVLLALFIVFLVWLYRRNKHGKIGQFIKGMGEGLKAILAMKQRVRFLFYTFLLWGSYLFLIYIGFWSLPATQHLSVAAALSVLVFGSLGMIVTPGGLGAYPPAVQLVLSMLYGLKGTYGLAYGWLSWLAQTLIVIVFGLLSFLILPLYNRNRHGQTPMDQQ